MRIHIYAYMYAYMYTDVYINICTGTCVCVCARVHAEESDNRDQQRHTTLPALASAGAAEAEGGFSSPVLGESEPRASCDLGLGSRDYLETLM